MVQRRGFPAVIAGSMAIRVPVPTDKTNIICPNASHGFLQIVGHYLKFEQANTYFGSSNILYFIVINVF